MVLRPPIRILAAVALGLLAGAASGTLGHSAFDGDRGPSEEVNHHPEEQLYSLLRTHGTFRHPQVPYVLSVQRVRGEKLLKPILKHLDARGNVRGVAEAEEADLRVDVARKTILLRMRAGTAHTADGSFASWADRVLELPLPDDLVAR
jgi:hypothetical protein